MPNNMCFADTTAEYISPHFESARFGGDWVAHWGQPQITFVIWTLVKAAVLSTYFFTVSCISCASLNVWVVCCLFCYLGAHLLISSLIMLVDVYGLNHKPPHPICVAIWKLFYCFPFPLFLFFILPSTKKTCALQFMAIVFFVTVFVVSNLLFWYLCLWRMRITFVFTIIVAFPCCHLAL